jgi:hypothetical protein
MIIITGMHRSGTSLAANLLFELRMSFGETALLMPADRWNPRGYYENTEIHILNDRLLLGPLAPVRRFRTRTADERGRLLNLVMSVYRARYLLPGGTRGLSRRAARLAGEIRAMAETYDQVAVKDPRFSLTIGEWAARARIDRVLYCYRHPLEVARSLRQRNGTPIRLGLRMWRTHVDTFLAHAERLPVIIVRHGAFFSARAVEEVGRLCAFAETPFDPDAARALIARVLAPDLRHHVHAGEPLDEATAARYARLHELHGRHGELRPLGD